MALQDAGMIEMPAPPCPSFRSVAEQFTESWDLERVLDEIKAKRARRTPRRYISRYFTIVQGDKSVPMEKHVR
jgi:hypothetical protein